MTGQSSASPAAVSETIGSPTSVRGSVVKPFLEVRGVSKAFGSTVALSDVSFSVSAGEVHCLVGENGAGKSTLMNTLYGFDRPDSGTIAVNGVTVDIASPSAALKLGIGMVHQHLMLVPSLTVIENVALGLANARRSLGASTVREKVERLAERLGISLRLDDRVEKLALGQRQQVEILKALARDAKLVILDEPTSVLSPPEIDKFGSLVRALAENGAAMVLITHKLREATEFSDRLTVMRAGRVISTGRTQSYDHGRIVREMFGDSVVAFDERRQSTYSGKKKVRFSAHKLRVHDDHGNTVVDGVSFDISSGEILGVAGVSGNGQSHLCEALAGVRFAAEGSIVLDDLDVNALSAQARRKAGLAYVPEERRDGLAMQMSVEENLYMNRFSEPQFSSFGIMKRKSLAKHARRIGSQFSVPVTRFDSQVCLLSGGNQQRIALAKALEVSPHAVIASQPTVGLDLKTVNFVQSSLLDLRDRGAAVLYVSTEIDELFALADRIAVMYRGRFAKIVSRKEFSREVLGPLMINGRETAR